jgi:mannose-6-phosphate isomerase
VILLETQQTSDITYRLYDYGRPRELHIEKAIEATRYQTSAGKIAPIEKEQGTLLIDQKYFAVDRFALVPKETIDLKGTAAPHTLVLVEGNAEIVTDSVPLKLKLGHAAVVPATQPGYRLRSTGGGAVVRSIPPLV